MVVGAFPAAKLGALLLKQISKPIANAVKSQAKSSPVFRKYVCMPPAQFYNWCEVKTKMWILNLGKPVNIPVLNEAMAIELGANLLGEGIIFIIAAGILISEYNRSANKEAAKEEAKKQEMTELQYTIRELFIQTEEQAAQLRELTRKLGALETKFGIPNTIKSGSTSTPKTPPSSRLPLDSAKSDKKINDKNKDKDTVPSLPEKGYQPNPNFTIQNVAFAEETRREIQYNSVILKSLDEIEDQFWKYPLNQEEEQSILYLGLYHVQRLLRLLD